MNPGIRTPVAFVILGLDDALEVVRVHRPDRSVPAFWEVWRMSDTERKHVHTTYRESVAMRLARLIDSRRKQEVRRINAASRGAA